MAEEKEKKQDEKKPSEKLEEHKEEERIVRILSKDIPGKMTLYSGLTKIRGVSWALSNAICKILGFNKRKKVGSLTSSEIKNITDFVNNPKVPDFIINRRADFDTGENKHITGVDLDLRKDFDIKRLKKIKSYRGLRHLSGLPTRGQRTRSNFRKERGKSAGIKKKKPKKE